MVSTWSHMSPASLAEYQSTALLPGMCMTDHCLVHNYLPNPVVNEMSDLVTLVGNSPHCTRTYYYICEAGGNTLPRHLCAMLTLRSLSSSSIGEGRLSEAMCAACCLYTPHASEVETSRDRVRNQARVQQCLSYLTCKACGAASCQHAGKGHAERLC